MTDEGFIGRWSRRKRAAREPGGDETPGTELADGADPIAVKAKPQRPGVMNTEASEPTIGELAGPDEPAADAEAIAVAVDGLRLLGLTSDDVRVSLNDRRFLRRMLRELDVGESSEAETLACIDKLGRDRSAAARLEELLGPERAAQIQRIDGAMGHSFCSSSNACSPASTGPGGVNGTMRRIKTDRLSMARSPA